MLFRFIVTPWEIWSASMEEAADFTAFARSAEEAFLLARVWSALRFA